MSARKGGKLSQGKIVALIALALLLVFSLTLDGFASTDNVLSLLQSVTVIGILGLGMAITIIGRGIDLSMIAMAVMPVAWSFIQISEGVSPQAAIAGAVLVAIGVGLLNGWLVAYVEVPAIFATLASGTTVYGAMQYLWVSNDLIPIPAALDTLRAAVRGATLGIPNTVIALAILALLIAAYLRLLVAGRFTYAIGDNPNAARITGLPVRPNMMLQYVLSALMALVAGYLLAFAVDGANTRTFNSTLIYDVILVVVLGGIGLSGGKGGVGNVLVGTVLIGILGNGMTILNIDYYTQNLVKASILLLAIVADSVMNPRDEQTSQQGDI